jgi:hypothetical protein
MQAALDSTSLMLSKDLTIGTVTQSQGRHQGGELLQRARHQRGRAGRLDQRRSGDVYISVVPFEIDVNVGTPNVNASWLRWDLWDPNNYSSSFTPHNT